MIEADKQKIAVALLQEPYVGGAKNMKQYKGARIFQNTSNGEGTVKAEIAVFDQKLDVVQYPKFTTNNIVVVKIQTSAWKIILVSYYFEPDQPIEPYLEHLNKISRELGPDAIIIGGDSNAKSTWWGSPTIDQRGEDMAGALEEMKLQVLNMGNTPTFDTIRGNVRYTSYVDVTACTEDLLSLVEDWKVAENLVNSDHNSIIFKVRLQKAKGMNVQRTTRIYNTKKANWDQLLEKLDQSKIENNINSTEINKIETKEILEKYIEKYSNLIKEACEQAIAKIKAVEKLTLPWWSEELAAMKKEVTTKKRRIRCAAPIRREYVVAQYLQAKEKYEIKAKEAQTKSWKDFCGKQDRENLWQGIYRVIGKTTKRIEDIPLTINGKELTQRESVELLADTFYPGDTESEDNADHRQTRNTANHVNDWIHGEIHDPPFTMDELKTAVESFNPKKAPGADGLTADICAKVISWDPETYLALTNKCLELGCFPATWKTATVVVLRKPDKADYGNPKSYRPIGLLPVLGKIFEKMIVGRLKFHLIPRMSTRQYGFTPQRSTEDSLYNLMQTIHGHLNSKKLVTIVSLDIEGAFDSAWWPAIRVRLAEEECPVNIRRVIDHYLEDRQVKVRYAGEEFNKETYKGCVQGSIGGPILWNLLLDPLLKELERKGEYCQAFADDVVLVFAADTALEVQGQANPVLEHVRKWGVKNKLKFAPHKTKAMIITNKLKFDTPLLSMGGVNIGLSDEIKILGLTIDRKLTFNSHTANACRKAVNIYKQLSRAAKISWGLNSQVIRTIYTTAVEPIITYAASAWAPATNKLGIQKQLNSVQRGFAQKICGAYRTVSLNSALVLAGILPLDLRIKEAAALYEVRRGVSRSELGDREMERVEKYQNIPHPAKQLSLEFTSLEDQQSVDKNVNQQVRIFTDGSKIEGKVGAALSVWKNDAEIKTLKLKLSSHCTVYQAELLAIHKATDIILENKDQSFAILSDSMSALQSVTNNTSLHPLAVKSRSNIQSAKLQNKDISLFWIKAHAGMEGNERADQLAKMAALKSKTKPNYDLCPISFAKREIRMDSLGEWNSRYNTSATASVTKLFFPDAIQAYNTIRSIRPWGEISQILTGHGGFAEYLTRFKCKEDPSCACGSGANQTVEHILAECQMYDKERFDAEQLLDSKIIAKNFKELINGKNSQEHFLEYCKYIATKTIALNR